VTIQDAIRITRTIKPNQYSDDDMTRWLSDLDGQVYRDVILTHEREHERHRERMIYPRVRIWTDGREKCLYSQRYHPRYPSNPHPYVLPKDAERELLIPHPYEDAYVKYLSAQVDYHNGEYERYNNAMMMFNTVYQAYANGYNREHMPRQDDYVVI